jgi:hypothetical protein
MEVPPLPAKPDLEARPRSSWMTIPLVVLLGMALAAVLTILTLGYFGPVVVLGFGVFFIIGFQYLVWGWWFEKIYRTPSAIAAAEAKDAGLPASVPPASSLPASASSLPPSVAPNGDKSWSR